MRKNNILFVHPIKQFSGSLKSLEEYLKLLDKKFNFIFLSPKGEASNRLKKFGKVITVIGLSKFDNSQLGYYKNFRWLIILRELFFFFPTLFSVMYIKKKKFKIDIIHFNEITLIPTIFLFKFFFKIPFILHCRILFKKENFFGKKICNYLKKNIYQIIAIDNDVKESFPKFLNIEIVRNILVKLPKKKVAKKKFHKKSVTLGYMGSFLKYKGLEDLIGVYKILKKENFKINLYLAGNFISNNKIFEIFKISNNINRDLINFDGIKNMGHINKLENFYSKIDLLCFPSYLNALGRQVFEAAYFKIPSIVCIKKKKSDSFIHNLTGMRFQKPGSQKDLKKIIKFFYRNKKKIKSMGDNAFKLVTKNYNIENNYLKLEKIYMNSLKISKKRNNFL